MKGFQRFVYIYVTGPGGQTQAGAGQGKKARFRQQSAHEDREKPRSCIAGGHHGTGAVETVSPTQWDKYGP